MPLKPRPLHEP